jgi:membrane protein DedA with SNARE-associated domain
MVLTVLRDIGLPGLFALMLVESFGIPPLPSEVILPFAGVLIVEGASGFNWPTVVLVALVGSLAGSFLAYELSVTGGRALLRRWGRRVYIREEEIARAERYFDQHGEGTVFVCRLIPLARAYISYPAGAAKMDRTRFGVFTTLGALPFIVVMVYLGTILGNDFTVLQHYFNYLDVVVVAAIVLVVAWFFLRARQRAIAERGGAVPPTA